MTMLDNVNTWTVCLYGLRCKAEAYRDAFETIRELACNNDSEITHLNGRGSVLPKKPAGLKRWLDKKSDSMDWSDFDSLMLYRMRPKNKVWLDGYLECYNLYRYSDIFAASLTHDARLDVVTAQYELLSSLVKVLQPEYGMGFWRVIGKGPILYSTGMTRGLSFPSAWTPSQKQESEQITTFAVGRPSKLWNHGVLGAIYPWNFLTGPQLEADVNGTPLREWVGLNPLRGELKPFGCDVWLWEVPETSIPHIEQTMWKAGRLLDRDGVEALIAKIDTQNDPDLNR